MAKRIEYDCVGCETCFHCGREERYPVWECDNCHEESTDPDFIFETIDGKDLCGKCYDKLYMNDEESEDE
ncbi:MAG: hypothetical protein KBT03_09315 [Bacteroidales bacterium]|nr:hypothetical protein [Candidatus Scybalousia scybalohippi]